MYALVDANSFYASAEQVFRPDWRNKPIIVLSNNDGCIVAANRLAIEAGIKKFQPFYKVKDLCNRTGIIVASSNYELYADLSSKMMQVIGRFGPEQHIYSIDESFLSFRNTQKMIPSLFEHGTLIRKAVWKETRLAVCVGFGKTLTLAKVANHAAKKLPQFKGVCSIETEKERVEILKQLKPRSIWGIGAKTAEKLALLGIKNGYQLSNLKPHQIKRDFNVELLRTVKELNGEECKNWEGGIVSKQQIYSTRSLGNRVTDLESLHQALSEHADIATRKARQQNSLCSTFVAFAANSPFDAKPMSFRFTHHFSSPTNDLREFNDQITRRIGQLFLENVSYYKIGIGLIELVNEKHYQLDLFSRSKSDTRVMKVFDEINQRYGDKTVKTGSQGTSQQWSMKRDFLSKQYTTSWKDIPLIKC